MHEKHVEIIAAEQNLNFRQVSETIKLLESESTVPFIARYRKEATGGLDEVAVITIRDRFAQLLSLDKRRDTILKSLEEQDVLSDELKAKVLTADSLSTLEDIYLPYRPKRRTRSTIAKAKGLEPLAKLIFAQKEINLSAEASKFINPDKEVGDVDSALAGARDIMAEWINEDSLIRAQIRRLFIKKAFIRSQVSKGKEKLGEKFKDYFDWQEPISSIPSHRFLAIQRGEKEGFLSYSIQPDEQEALDLLERRLLKTQNAASEQVKLALTDSYSRLLQPSMETEMRNEFKQKADIDAIQVFAENLRELLMAPPLGQKNVLAIDPGYRTGCKVVCLNRQANLLHNHTIYPLEPQKKTEEAAKIIRDLVSKFKIEAIAVGNGTGGRETHAFCRGLGLDSRISIEMVNESGASVYSASQIAREEFPDFDVTVRGAVSIGRRLIDPLSELVKIDPKSIGVGQYQHDVDQKELKKALDDTVKSCVNAVGVEVNTASKELLSYVSGLGPKLAASFVAYRSQNGPFRSRKLFMKVPGMGQKTFEQAAGFMRIQAGENPLDASAVHPESYPIVEQMANDTNSSIQELMEKESLRDKIQLEIYVSNHIGLPTLTDIRNELAKPGRDPRQKFKAMTFAEGIQTISDLKPGMQVPGIVTNVTNFGAFVDVGVHNDGLVHISQLADRFVTKPADVVKVGQQVSVRILDVDLERNRIALSMRSDTVSNKT